MQSTDLHHLNAPFFDASTMTELEDKLNNDEIFQKNLPSNIKQEITNLIYYWSMKCSGENNTRLIHSNTFVEKLANKQDEFSEATSVETNHLQPNSVGSPLNEFITTFAEESDDEYSAPATPPSFGIHGNVSTVMQDPENVEFSLMDNVNHHNEKKPSSDDHFAPNKETDDDNMVNEEDNISSHDEYTSETPTEPTAEIPVCSAVGKLEDNSVSSSVEISEKTIKKSFSTFISKIKGVFKKSKVDLIKPASVNSKSLKSKKKKESDSPVPLDLNDITFVESVFDRLQAPLTPNIKLVMERKTFFNIEDLEKEIKFWQEEKTENNEFLAKFGLSPWRPVIDERGDFHTMPGHGLDRFDFCPFGSGLPTPHRLRISESDFQNDRVFELDDSDSDNEDRGKSRSISNASFLEEFEARQRGVFSYMDSYVEPPMSEYESSDDGGSRLIYGRHQFKDESAHDDMASEKRSSGDELLDEVWKQSEEYQEYLSSAEIDDDDENASYYGLPLKLVSGKRNVSSSIWNPPTLHQVAHASVENNLRSHVTHSRTEVNMKTQDPVPYVKIEAAPTTTANKNTKEHRIPRKQVKHLVVDINDGALYKRSVSAYSTLKDYDIVWQKTFHDEQHDIDKVQTTFQSISWALYNILRQNHLEGNFQCNSIFLSPDISYDDDLWEAEPLTEWSDIFMEMAAIFERTDLTSEHAIIAFIYLQRMAKTSGQCLFDGSWQRILMLSLLTAAKVWEDCSIYNSDYSQLFPDVSTRSINKMEVSYLGYLDWNVNVKCSEFASTYFELRELQEA